MEDSSFLVDFIVEADIDEDDSCKLVSAIDESFHRSAMFSFTISKNVRDDFSSSTSCSGAVFDCFYSGYSILGNFLATADDPPLVN
jgi:hypothetical protein